MRNAIKFALYWHYILAKFLLVELFFKNEGHGL